MASRYRRLRARLLKAFFRAHAEVYERSGGRVGAWLGLPTLLLSFTGRKSGKRYSTPLVYFEDGGSYLKLGFDLTDTRPRVTVGRILPPRHPVRRGAVGAVRMEPRAGQAKENLPCSSP